MRSHLHAFLLAALLTGSLAAEPDLIPGGPAQDKPVPGEKKGQKKAGAKKAEGAEAPRAAGGLTAKVKSEKKKRMRRQVQSGNIDGLRQSVQTSLDQADPKLDRDLLAITAFYKSGLLGLDGDSKGCLEWVDKAIDYGYLSGSGFEDLTLIPAGIKESEAWKKKMQDLRQKAEVLVWKDFTEQVRAAMARPSAKPLALPALDQNPLKADGGGAEKPEKTKETALNLFDSQKVEGMPLLIVVTPIHHDGFEKEIPELEKLSKTFAGQAEIGVFFYQYDVKDSGRVAKTLGYVAAMTRLTLPVALVGRDFVNPLEVPYYPAHLFLTGAGKVAYRRDGYLGEKEMEFILTELKGTKVASPKKPAEPPAEPAPPKPAPPAAEAEGSSKPDNPDAPPKPPAPAKPPAEKAKPPAPKPDEKPAEKPADKPAAKPAEKPEPKPDEDKG